MGVLLSAEHWGTAAIVWAFTREGVRGPVVNPETLKDDSLSVLDDEQAKQYAPEIEKEQ